MRRGFGDAIEDDFAGLFADRRRGKQGQDYLLGSIRGLIVVSLLCGRRGMKPAPLLGRSPTRRQKGHLGFVR